MTQPPPPPAAGFDCEPWPLDPTCLPQGWSADPAQWNPRQQRSAAIAAAILRSKTAGMYGLCRLTVRPFRTPCRVNASPSTAVLGVVEGGAGWVPVLEGGDVVNHGGPGGCGGCPACTHVCTAVLEPFGHSVIEVRIDGQPVEASTYELRDGGRTLARLGACWPDCQELDKPDGAPGTWSVTYRTGIAPDAHARLAVTLLTLEIDKACNPDVPASDCVLSEYVTEIVRDGVTISINNYDAIKAGATGVLLADQWVDSVNPRGITSTLSAWSPDVRPPVHTSWRATP